MGRRPRCSYSSHRRLVLLNCSTVTGEVAKTAVARGSCSRTITRTCAGYVTHLLGRQYDDRNRGDGMQALEAARVRASDLVITDVMMPKLDGFGLLAALRSDPQTKTCRSIVLSARAGEEARLEGLERGADDYLIKPFSARELLGRVRSQLELHRLREQAANEREQLLAREAAGPP